MTPATSVDQLFHESYRPLALIGCSRSCINHHLSAQRKWGRFLGRPPLVSDFSDGAIARFLEHMAAEHRSAATTNSTLRKLLALWRHAAKLGLVDRWPTVRLLIEPEHIPDSWSQSDLASLMRACDAQTGHMAGVPAALYWRAWHLLQWSSGERTGALLQLPWATVDLRGGWAVFRAEIRKGKRRDLLVPLRPETLAALEAIASPRRQLVFPWDRHVVRWYHRYERLLVSAGLPFDRRCKPQKMRRSFASHLEAAGGNATAALGHSSRRITERSYLDPRVTQVSHPGDLLFRIDNPTPRRQSHRTR